ncbi:MAG: hypothetical protein COV74_05115 [Candidatus Omnitrophica bacterium CG11_big_fil_rev_8_21_14_0_20_45_26]|uniref:CAAX prenyl protease 2/Lysostaphin resistance protein A-like domain-containing protein n=1 Tax=Candidatus Abzuiibacterium crystallinum TaxID=1974748 RepID=A0A2H0LS63_9BACT|nr:MAG: hypothetical protein COV74_05115 [Candidatus Omnitrophica bacterium CG11_big_fil_rev_8_21_14_0_20_45_26]PIW63532.1 MAG: hypothetical protein COW12_10025 [Candidatus Omnitrophica bacterium CG12_big_fil_rev_8_21_14_0_65_45_16]
MRFIRLALDWFFSEKPYLGMFFFILIYFAVMAWMENLLPHEFEPLTESSSVQTLENVMEARQQDEAFLARRFEEKPYLKWLSDVFMSGITLGILIGSVLNVFLIKKTIQKKPWLEAAHTAPAVSWGMNEIFKAVILFVFAGVGLNLFFMVMDAVRLQPSDSNFLLILHTSLTDVFIAGLIIYFVTRARHTVARAFGLPPHVNAAKECWVGVQAYFAVIPSFLMMMLLLVVVTNFFHWSPDPHPLVGIFIEEETKAPWLVTYSWVLACFIGPVIEEVFFRGFVYPVFKKHWGIRWGMVLSAAFFALIHGNWFAFFPVFFLGMVLCYLYERRGSLISCISLHVLHNCIFVTYFFLTKAILGGAV